jgi:hypothetical protein
MSQQLSLIKFHLQTIRSGLVACIVALVLIAECDAQQLQRQVMAAGGGVIAGPGGSLSQTTGQSAQAYHAAAPAAFSQGFQQPELDLRLSPVIGPFCNGDTLMLSFSKLGYFGPAGSVVAELSDALGDFSAPQVIGSTISASGTVFNAVIPFTLVPGSGYKIRLRTSGPSRVSNASASQNVDLCSVRLNISALIEGLYSGSGTMQAALYNAGINTDPTASDSVRIELHEATAPFGIVQSFSTILHTDGNASCVFPASIYGGTYYVVLRHRNAVETWSKNAVLFNTAVRSYDFVH